MTYLTEAQARVLRQLPKSHPLHTMKYRSVKGRKSTFSALIRKGLVERFHDSYHAVWLLAITPAGREALAEYEKEKRDV